MVNSLPLSMLKRSACFWWFCIATFLTNIICLILILLASPLDSIEVTSFGNVLATQKQLIFDLYVKARYTIKLE